MAKLSNSIFLTTKMLLLLVATYGNPTPSVAADDLSISISFGGGLGGRDEMDIDSSFQVLLKNNTEKELQVWSPHSKQGYYALTFEAVNLKTGKIFKAVKRHVEDDNFFESSEDGDDDFSDTEGTDSRPNTIMPGGTLTIDVRFLGYAWGELAWIGIPEPDENSQYKVTAKYEVTSTDVREPTIWNGSIESDPLEISVISKRLKTPFDYLSNNLPQLALRMMQEEPNWIFRRNDNSETPLHVAAHHKHLDVVKWLLDNGAHVDAIAYNGFTPLHLTSDPEVVELVLKYKPNLSIRCRISGETPLQDAIGHESAARSAAEKKKWQTIANLYLAAGAEYDIITAIHRNDLPRVKAILSKADLQSDQFRRHSPLRCAASLGHLEICKYLVQDLRMDVNQFEEGLGYPIIKDALAHPEVVRLLMENGADLEQRMTWRGGRSGMWIIGDDATALHYAAADGVPETVKLLLDEGVDPFATTRDDFQETPNRQTALDVAAVFGKADNAEEIVNHQEFSNGDPESRQSTLDRCLILGSSSSSLGRDPDPTKLVEVLLDKGANANSKDEKGRTAIQVAARSSQSDSQQKEVISILMEHGGKLDLFSAVAIDDEPAVARMLSGNSEAANARSYDGLPALHLAVEKNKIAIIKMLLDSGADVNMRSESEIDGIGETALHCAAFWGRAEVGEMLLDRGADVNAVDSSGSTPLHEATRLTNLEMVKLLLKNNSPIDAKNRKGKTPLDLCRELNSGAAKEIEKVLLEYQKP